jgi:hypothetical protein
MPPAGGDVDDGGLAGRGGVDRLASTSAGPRSVAVRAASRAASSAAASVVLPIPSSMTVTVCSHASSSVLLVRFFWFGSSCSVLLVLVRFFWFGSSGSVLWFGLAGPHDPAPHVAVLSDLPRGSTPHVVVTDK